MVQGPPRPWITSGAVGGRGLAGEQQHADDLRRVGRGGPGGSLEVRGEDLGGGLAGLGPAPRAVLAHPDAVPAAAAVERDVEPSVVVTSARSIVGVVGMGVGVGVEAAGAATAAGGVGDG